MSGHRFGLFVFPVSFVWLISLYSSHNVSEKTAASTTALYMIIRRQKRPSLRISPSSINQVHMLGVFQTLFL